MATGGKLTEVGISTCTKPTQVGNDHEEEHFQNKQEKTFHMDPRSPGDLAEKASQNSSHAFQIVANKRNNN